MNCIKRESLYIAGYWKRTLSSWMSTMGYYVLCAMGVALLVPSLILCLTLFGVCVFAVVVIFTTMDILEAKLTKTATEKIFGF